MKELALNGGVFDFSINYRVIDVNDVFHIWRKA